MKTNLIRQAISAAALAFLGCSAQLVQAGTVTVITSFPKELTQIYKTAFEKAGIEFIGSPESGAGVRWK